MPPAVMREWFVISQPEATIHEAICIVANMRQSVQKVEFGLLVMDV